MSLKEEHVQIVLVVAICFFAMFACSKTSAPDELVGECIAKGESPIVCRCAYTRRGSILEECDFSL